MSPRPLPLRRSLRSDQAPRRSRELAVAIRSEDRVVALDIAMRLRRRGGLPSRSRPGLYEFASDSARDMALDEARGRYGWTCVEPSSTAVARWA